MDEKMTDLQLDTQLKMHYGLIVDNCIPRTSGFTYGKDVRLGESIYPLENWHIKINVYEDMDLTYKAINENIKTLVKEKASGMKTPACFELCGWSFLESEDGQIVCNGAAHLVKYAVVVDIGDMCEGDVNVFYREN